ncbi:hypothetical protein OG413_41190 [Streptomyces sp. NBC_01433]|uniref:hypothetical protein n=1 Tax=Streptomyces sp. NBC_01433 TaxID=2903864 RepID=UPI002253DC4A|nr:hypothetical protein [Streptomyces sp. NBC_01433]MCX4681619.1 hypothetical protein [Streptomyces sp. NBC_01433]
MEEHMSLRPAAPDHGATRQKAETVIQTLLGDREIRRLGEEIRLEEIRLGLQLRPKYQALQDRHDQAVRDLNHVPLPQACFGKHGRWGHICVLNAGHETVDPHWGINNEGQPVAWVGSAPEDD